MFRPDEARWDPGASQSRVATPVRDFVQSAPPPFRQVLRLQVHSIHDLQVHDSRRAAWLLLLSAIAVLAIGCTNAANLVLARSTGPAPGIGGSFCVRRRARSPVPSKTDGERYVRAHRGSDRHWTCLPHSSNSVLLAPTGIPRLSETSIDIRILLFALAVSLISGIFFGTAPALERPPQMLSVNAVAGLRPSRLRQGLLVVEVWIAIILMTSAFLFVRSLRKLQAEPLGINTQNIVTAELTLGQQKYSSAKKGLRSSKLWREGSQTPRFDAAALTDSLPPIAPARTMPYFALQGEGQPPLAPLEGVGGIVGWRCVTPDYFSALGITLLRGRPFNEQDRASDAHTIILNQALARKMFSTEDVLGKKIQFRTDRAALSSPFTIVGVTGNAQNQGLGGASGPSTTWSATTVTMTSSSTIRIRSV